MEIKLISIGQVQTPFQSGQHLPVNGEFNQRIPHYLKFS